MARFLFLFVAFLAVPVVGQVCPPGAYCPPSDQGPTEVSVLNWYQRLTFAPGSDTPQARTEAATYRFRAVRITVSGSCGSGSLVGRDERNIYILSNAHVTTNRPGTVVNCEASLRDLSGTERFRATVIEP